MTHAVLSRPATTRRLARWVLLLWLMAIGCAGSAPLLQPIQPRLDCVTHKNANKAAQRSVSKSAQAGGPTSNPAQALPAEGGGLWHCSQCLMAGPPSAWPATVSLVQRAARAAAEKPASSPLLPSLSLRPPARAPPIS